MLQHIATGWQNANKLLHPTVLWYCCIERLQSFGWGLKVLQGCFIFISESNCLWIIILIIMVSTVMFFEEEKTYCVAIQLKDIEQYRYFPVCLSFNVRRQECWINILLLCRNKYYWKEHALQGCIEWSCIWWDLFIAISLNFLVMSKQVCDKEMFFFTFVKS